MSIRGKFFALAGILLMLFGIVVGVLAISQASVAHQLENIVAHYQPLRRLLADLDVDTDEYELRIERLRRRPDQSDAELQSAAAEIERVGARIRENFRVLRMVLDRAVAHNQNDPGELHELSEVQGALPFIERQVDPFLASG